MPAASWCRRPTANRCTNARCRRSRSAARSRWSSRSDGDGQGSAAMRERMKRTARALWRLVLRWQNTLVGAALLALVLVGFRLYPHAPLSAAQAGSSTALFGADGSLLRLTLSPDDKYRQWLPLAQMPPALVEAVLLHEDAWFRWHPGFNPLSLARGAWISYVRGGHRQGGSTLTMQLARL